MFTEKSYIAFAGTKKIASGDKTRVSLAVKSVLISDTEQTVLVFDEASGAQIDLDLRSTAQEPPAKRSPGRPKLGVVGREVTLLPRHWDWLKAQPGGASVALRKLVDQARRDNEVADRIRHSQEATFRFISAIAGNEPGFEEANRALFACDVATFRARTKAWPSDVRDFAAHLAQGAFDADSSEDG